MKFLSCNCIHFIVAMNPCPCGYYNTDKKCICTQNEIDRYRHRISGPILDRFDIFCEVNEVSFSIEDNKLNNIEDNKLNNTLIKTVNIREKINKVRKIQSDRFKKEKIELNSKMSYKQVIEYCKFDVGAEVVLNKIYNKYRLSNRSYLNIVKLSRTIADLEEKELISSDNILEAFSFRRAFYKYFMS